MTTAAPLNISADAAVAACPELQRLLDLGTAGWRFVRHEDYLGVYQIDAFWRWPSGWLDCLRIHSVGHAMGLRADNFTPPRIVWEISADPATVIHALTTLPPPGEQTSWCPHQRAILGEPMKTPTGFDVFQPAWL